MATTKKKKKKNTGKAPMHNSELLNSPIWWRTVSSHCFVTKMRKNVHGQPYVYYSTKKANTV